MFRTSYMGSNIKHGIIAYKGSELPLVHVYTGFLIVYNSSQLYV